MIEPKTSWVAGWQGQRAFKPGMYAIAVEGEDGAAEAGGEDEDAGMDDET